MKKLLLCLITLVMAYNSSYAGREDVKWYLPKGVETFNKEIPTPETVLGFKTGEKHITYDQILIYMRRLAAVSPRIKIIEQGFTPAYTALSIRYSFTD